MNSQLSKLTSTALRTNAVFTALCGAVCTVDGRALASAIGLSSPLAVWAVGGVYVVFGAALWLVAQRGRRVEAVLATVADGGYVAASLGLLLLAPTAVNAMGRVAVGGVAALVATLVAAQAIGLREGGLLWGKGVA